MTRPTRDASEHEQTAKHDERGRNADAVATRDVIEHEPDSERRGTWLSASIVLLGAIVIGSYSTVVTRKRRRNAEMRRTAVYDRRRQ
ncbi:hypothetical protein [Natrialba aegyptia]|uniref:Uncharacterized protein n=1 Tax=Natrialba aegyptia DSM 13077 TaxID=1227491 RepID=M0B0N6_9EURY|nr:hypothetical protein [Natrialba aegyptia]ELZ03259.1 hypothetical protein C480_16040 [Natrialba aegyptia DSM 13077]